MIDSNKKLNIGSGKEIAICDLASLIKEIIGYKGSLEFGVSKLDGTPRKLLDVTRLNAKGWSNRISLKQGVASTYMRFKNHH